MITVPILQTRPLSYERLSDLPKVNWAADVTGRIGVRARLTTEPMCESPCDVVYLSPFPTPPWGSGEAPWSPAPACQAEALHKGDQRDAEASVGPQGTRGLPRMEVLNWDWLCSPGDIWPCLKTLLTEKYMCVYIHTHLHMFIINTTYIRNV